jgi:hypothetical protein
MQINENGLSASKKDATEEWQDQNIEELLNGIKILPKVKEMVLGC